MYELNLSEERHLCLNLEIQPAQLGCLGGSAGRGSAWYVVGSSPA